jgi:hypothetical protein
MRKIITGWLGVAGVLVLAGTVSSCSDASAPTSEGHGRAGKQAAAQRAHDAGGHAGHAAGAVHEKADKAQTTCPVMGGAINKALYADHGGKRIYVCCGGCVSAIKKHPDKYIKKLEDQGVTLEKAP